MANSKLKSGKHPKQTSFTKTNWDHRYKHGGELRKKRAGRGQRPLSTKNPHHIVFKVNKFKLRPRTLRSYQTFALSRQIIQRYAKKFFVKIEQVTIQHDHIHMLIRTSRRSLFQNFFRVVAGQIAQQFLKQGLLRSCVTDTLKAAKKKVSLWKFRPFSHMAKSYKAYLTIRNYIQLNENEVTGTSPYRKNRLKGMSIQQIEALWR